MKELVDTEGCVGSSFSRLAQVLGWRLVSSGGKTRLFSGTCRACHRRFAGHWTGDCHGSRRAWRGGRGQFPDPRRGGRGRRRANPLRWRTRDRNKREHAPSARRSHDMAARVREGVRGRRHIGEQRRRRGRRGPRGELRTVGSPSNLKSALPLHRGGPASHDSAPLAAE